MTGLIALQGCWGWLQLIGLMGVRVWARGPEGQKLFIIIKIIVGVKGPDLGVRVWGAGKMGSGLRGLRLARRGSDVRNVYRLHKS